MLGLLLSVALAGETFQGQDFFLGELHSHTGASGDGGSSDLGECEGSCGAVADLGPWSRSAGLDFMAVTDHVNGPATATPQDFGLVWQQVLSEHGGDLVTIPGAELWLRWPDGTAIGHKDILLFDDDTALLETVRMVDLQPNGDDTLTVEVCEDLWAWAASFEARFGPALLLPHHPALSLPMETDWSCHDPVFSPAVEVYSEHGNSLASPAEWDPGWSPAVPESTVESALDQGLDLGFVGGTDAHDSRPGSVCGLDTERTDHPYAGSLTVVVLDPGEVLTRSAIHTAILDKRSYTTSGPLVPVAVDWQVDGVSVGGHGASPEVPESGRLGLHLTLPTTWSEVVTSARLRGSGQWWELAADGDTWSVTVAAADLTDWLYVDLTLAPEVPEDCDDGGEDDLEHVWLSPIRPVVVPDDTGVDSGSDSGPDSANPGDSASTPGDSGGRSGRCGCGASPASGGWALVLVLGAALRRRR